MPDISKFNEVPLAGNVVSVVLSMTTIAVLATCLTRRLQTIHSWRALPLTSWLLIAIYVDSGLFVFVTAVISHGVDLNSSGDLCGGAILLCLICYLTTKIMIYLFLVEKAYIIRGSRQSRLKNKLYVVNFFGLIVPYVVVIVMNFVYRFSYINKDGVCIIGMKRISMIPLITLDVILNVYLTMLFLLPLRKLYSYQHNVNPALRKMAMRTFIGSCATLISSVVNLTVLMVLEGEPGWVCLMCCNADILFSVIVLHWVTAVDSVRSPANSTPRPTGSKSRDRKSGNPANTWTSKLSGKEAGMVTTSCVGNIRHKTSELELDKIRVQTEQTQEVEVGAKSAVTTDSAHAHQDFLGRSNSTERMV
ncbi:uncharacterized protein BDZ99DRAFT_567569 [Mytilinidion resinicola]|uniref:G-protein coupled receptors family 1 profile domain-containing protein n=1 Tax=Mytilinidion resinicola TaxID=574789 RepID=A0A6A6YZG8_9PEZI|nr:uncharacterized protein BDZ99DRAFT_567569 [Mytilinidion resinicola]KAF2813843.1 hypothetical protein BDZ99DRAFT_567569 [Mytilinidion resinicola]